MANALYCRNHPGVAAADLCRTCSIRYCHDCLIEVGSNFYCENCARDAKAGASTQAIASVIVGVPGLLIPVLAGVALVLGYKSMMEISKGQSPVAGKKWATGGAILGGVGLLVWLVGLFIRR